MSDTNEFSKTFDGIFVVGLGMPYKTQQKSGVSYMSRCVWYCLENDVSVVPLLRG